MQTVLAQWPQLVDAALEPCHVGLINETWFTGTPPSAVLQKIHPVFGRDVHVDIAAITAHVAGKSLLTPELIKTASGELSFVDDDGGIWRLMTFIPGITVESVQDENLAFEAGRLVGKWHAAVDDLTHSFHFKRSGVHDTEAHMGRLEQVLSAQENHRLQVPVRKAATAVLEQWSHWQGELHGTPRICHGDLKISNLRFDVARKGIALLDLDTLGEMSLDVELGDAWRSWCNRGGEDQSDSHFDVGIFEASLRGYCGSRGLTSEEAEGLEWGTERIALELAARFLVDAIEETYFGWDSARFQSRGEHNLLRGQGQLALASSVASQRHAMSKVLQRVLSVKS